ncbi:MAG: hypothetical protein JSV80_07110, partial [Acidobacteriota bacterium]
MSACHRVVFIASVVLVSATLVSSAATPGQSGSSAGAIVALESLPDPSEGLPHGLVIDVPRGDGIARLELERRSWRRADFRFSTSDADGRLREVHAPPSRTYRGRLAGVSGSVAVASLTERGLTATVWSAGGNELFSIVPLRDRD